MVEPVPCLILPGLLRVLSRAHGISCCCPNGLIALTAYSSRYFYQEEPRCGIVFHGSCAALICLCTTWSNPRCIAFSLQYTAIQNALQISLATASSCLQGLSLTSTLRKRLLLSLSSRFATCASLIVTAKTSTGSHAQAQLWSLLGRQLNTKLHPDTEALHQVRNKGCVS